MLQVKNLLFGTNSMLVHFVNLVNIAVVYVLTFILMQICSV